MVVHIRRVLYQAKADLNLADDGGNTALHYTYWENQETGQVIRRSTHAWMLSVLQVVHNTKIYAVLCQHGADPGAINRAGRVPKKEGDAADELEREKQYSGFLWDLKSVS